MPIASHDRPQRADIITTYAGLERFVSAFADGKIDNTVLIIGASGLQKSRLVADVLGNRAHTIRGQTTPYGLYHELFLHRDEPLVFDDLDGVTPRLGKNCTLRAGGGAWPKTPCCESRRNTAISAVSGSFRGVDENFSFWSRSRIADGYSRKSKTSSEYDF